MLEKEFHIIYIYINKENIVDYKIDKVVKVNKIYRVKEKQNPKN